MPGINQSQLVSKWDLKIILHSPGKWREKSQEIEEIEEIEVNDTEIR